MSHSRHMRVTKQVGRVRLTSQDRLWTMKREAQARDRLAVSRGAISPESMRMLREQRLLGASIEWPDASLLDE